MNITYRVIDPVTFKVHDQGMYNNRDKGDISHFNRVAKRAYRDGLCVLTIATGHQAPVFETDSREFVQPFTQGDAA